MTDRYVLRGHEPVPEPDLLKWATWFEERNRKVARDEIDGWVVSTVFLALDHSFQHNAEPVLFETMVFGGSSEDEICERYCTWDEAVAGHAAAVERVKAVVDAAKIPSGADHGQ